MANDKQPASDASNDNARGRRYLLSFIVLLLAVGYMLWATRRLDVLRYIASGQFDWGSSTTSVPISAVSVLLKSLLSGDTEKLPPSLLDAVSVADTVSVQPVRAWLSARRLERLKAVCDGTRRRCNVKRVGAHGITALHLASASGDTALETYLRSLGAVDVFDEADRLPRNLSFSHFISNAKRAALARGDNECDLPIVNYDGGDAARREVARLVGEGEPVLIRNALRYLAPELMDVTIGDMVSRHGDVSVRVGSVPYASYFNLSTTEMRLVDFHTNHMVADDDELYPLYVFAKDDVVCAEGYEALRRLVHDSFPSKLFVAPESTGGVSETHFFLGRVRSGAPHHLHADAINAAVHGRKKWYIFTPQRSLYSRTPIAQWVDDQLPHLEDEHRPLECLQRPGDVVYVPLDWGHAVLNEDDAFGFALELLNRRDTLLDVAGRRPPLLR